MRRTSSRRPQHQMRVPVGQSGPKPPVESIAWWWNPGRTGVRSGPPTVMKKLAEVDQNLSMTWNSYDHHWSVWLRTPRVQHKICHGWTLLFNVGPDKLGEGELVLARLYSASARAFGGAKQYFDAIEREEARDKERRDAAQHFQTVEDGWDRMKHYQPRVGYGASNGSKVASFG